VPLDNIDRPDSAAEIREGLKNPFSVPKAQDANLRFVFLTGVTKFSLFSGLNQLNDLTLDARYATLCGYTQHDLEQLEVSEEILDSFDIERINPITLLFQSGYLTVVGTSTRRGRLIFHLSVPNQEVRLALHDQLITGYTGIENERLRLQDGLYDALGTGNVPALIAAIRRLFAGIPWRHFTGNDLAEAEGYYASVLYAFLASLDAQLIPEDISNQGQVDLTVRIAGYTYVMEIKLRRDALPAGRADQLAPRLTAGAGAADATVAIGPRMGGQGEGEGPGALPPGMGGGDEWPGTVPADQRGANPALAQIQARVWCS
jgi:hypothetical protein